MDGRERNGRVEESRGGGYKGEINCAEEEGGTKGDKANWKMTHTGWVRSSCCMLL